MTAHYVYEFYDADNNPLYVGCTANLGKRITNHAIGKEWWPLVARVAVDVYPDYQSGRAAEAELIASLEPAHNIIHTSREQDAFRRNTDSRAVNQAKRHDLGLCSPWNCPTCVKARRASMAAS